MKVIVVARANCLRSQDSELATVDMYGNVTYDAPPRSQPQPRNRHFSISGFRHNQHNSAEAFQVYNAGFDMFQYFVWYTIIFNSKKSIEIVL